MTRVYTHEIQTLEDGELYTANIWENGSEWSGLIHEFPEVKCREKTKEALVRTLEVRLLEALAEHADAWDKQIEADVDAGKFDAIAERVIADFDAGECKDVSSFLAQYSSSDVLESVHQFLKPALIGFKIANAGRAPRLSDFRAYTHEVLYGKKSELFGRRARS